MFGLYLKLHLNCDFLKQYFDFQRKLEGYEFPVYSTEFCPRGRSEWDQRSSAINCTETNGYMCLPNESLTELLEFCYIYPRLVISKGKLVIAKINYE